MAVQVEQRRFDNEGVFPQLTNGLVAAGTEEPPNATAAGLKSGATSVVVVNVQANTVGIHAPTNCTAPRLRLKQFLIPLNRKVVFGFIKNSSVIVRVSFPTSFVLLKLSLPNLWLALVTSHTEPFSLMPFRRMTQRLFRHFPPPFEGGTGDCVSFGPHQA